MVQPQPPRGEVPASSNVALLSDLSLSSVPELPAVPMPGTQIKLPPAPVIKTAERGEMPLPEPQRTLPVTTARKAEPVEIPPEILSQKIDRLEGFLVGLNNKAMEEMWKDMSMTDSRQPPGSVSVARCYPYSNRAPDVLPFDFNRVVLQNSRDDYINASSVTSTDQNQYIVTQAPLVKLFSEFWSMVWQEGIETVVCLATDIELAEAGYFPKEKGSVLKEGSFSLTAQSSRDCVSHLERVLHLTNSTTGQTRAILHLQITGWHQTEAVLDTAEAMARIRGQQRYSGKPVLVHCMDGGTRSGTFLVINSWLQDKTFDEGDLPEIKSKIQSLVSQRKGILRDKMVLKHIFEIILFSMKRTINKEIKGSVAMTEAVTPRKSSEQDFVGLSVASLKEELQKDVSVSPEPVQEKQESSELPVLVEESGKSSNLSQMDLSASSNSIIPSDLTQLADLSLTEPKTKKITKEDFFSPAKKVGATKDESDPLSQLDPLWSMK